MRWEKESLIVAMGHRNACLQRKIEMMVERLKMLLNPTPRYAVLCFSCDEKQTPFLVPGNF
jgi:hypothetical protein